MSKERTLRQKWSYERCFQHKGTLAGIRQRLIQVAEAKSTLLDERRNLLALADKVRYVWEAMDVMSEESLAEYERRSR